MQLLMEYSEENGGVKGLGLISGDVKYINNKRNFINGQKVPHIGWRSLGKSNIDWNDSILKGVQEADEFYFVHSLCVETSAVNELSVTNYSGVEFCSAIKYNNIFGCQFHPEKSGSVGLKVIENFTNI
jgi:glutamine amidotransferase